MTHGKKIPRIQSISKVDGFRVYCLFNTGERGVIDFEKLFEEWGMKTGDAEYPLLNVEEFQKVKVHDGVLSWENVRVFLTNEDGVEESFPYEIDPIVLYNQTELLSNVEESMEEKELTPAQQERLMRTYAEALAGKNLISDEEAWKRLERWAP